MRSAVALPLAAAGGIMDAAGLDQVLAAGAEAGQLGTAFLRTEESGARQLHKDALASPRFTQTEMTRAFTGRSARALVMSLSGTTPMRRRHTRPCTTSPPRCGQPLPPPGTRSG